MRRFGSKVRDYLDSLSRTGMVVAVLFFACSLTPSLLPRPTLYQGVVSGLSLALGYAFGVAGRWLWDVLELRQPGPRARRTLTRATLAASAVVAGIFLWEASAWQNSVRGLMGLEPVSSIRPYSVAAIAGVVFVLLHRAARLFLRTFRFMSGRLGRALPPRVSSLVGVAAAALLFYGVIDRVFLAWALRVADSVSQQVDATIPPDRQPPDDAQRTGSTASLISWQDLGLAGRNYIASGPTASDLTTFLGRQAPAPIRVYVGLNAGDSVEARAALALRELERVGAFERSVLIVITPTGTGWVDPAAMDSVEYLLRGDVASVAMQYSYLPSVLALPTEGAYGAENARALFHVIYDHWTHLPKTSRPKLYLYGVSLGALNSDQSFDLHDIIADPFQGALWSGPPFRGEHWRTITTTRDPGSPEWRPHFRDGSVVRFMNQQGGLDDGAGTWGPFRIAYLQYGSDPITFFSVDTLYREPDWMRMPRAFDVSPSFRWFPVVTTVELLADIAMANSVPTGFGHNFAAAHYIDAWRALMEPQGWTPDDVSRLKSLLAAKGL